MVDYLWLFFGIALGVLVTAVCVVVLLVLKPVIDGYLLRGVRFREVVTQVLELERAGKYCIFMSEEDIRALLEDKDFLEKLQGEFHGKEE